LSLVEKNSLEDEDGKSGWDRRRTLAGEHYMILVKTALELSKGGGGNAKDSDRISDPSFWTG